MAMAIIITVVNYGQGKHAQRVREKRAVLGHIHQRLTRKFPETLKKNVTIYCVALGKSVMLSEPYFLLWRKRILTAWSGYLAD